ncbi:hypothetical protein BJ138DRAFT_1118427 [Hygrophoropsis aurantiaca]|uniref:Uncharacterized protein n=1 Tax=Hygrophoropsis aurantiaca TaxID=72124 RepID=A0ACB7ZXP5_9AGAM|nr:hypothetical protein BJ138DRAFT_1118427 [Hygrophoropsis aurantiaca]
MTPLALLGHPKRLEGVTLSEPNSLAPNDSPAPASRPSRGTFLSEESGADGPDPDNGRSDKERPRSRQATPAAHQTTPVTRSHQATPTARQTTPATLPAPTPVRQKHKFKLSDGDCSWFKSSAEGTIGVPPSIDDVLLEGDLYMHWVTTISKCQVWLWKVTDNSGSWAPVMQGHRVNISGSDRYLVITDGHQPSLVKKQTWETMYKRRPVLTMIQDPITVAEA